MFYRKNNDILESHPESPAVFGAQYGIIPTSEEIEKFAGYVWCDTEEQAKEFFDIPINTPQ